MARRAGGHEADHDGLPAYIKMGTEEEKRWHQRHPDSKRVRYVAIGDGNSFDG